MLKRHRWTPEEKAQLELLTGDVPWSRAVHRYRKWATANGHPSRTEGALRLMADELAGSRVAEGEWLRLGLVRRLLDLGPPAVQRWVTSGAIPVHREGQPGPGRCRYYVHRKQLRRFALSHPRYFAGLSQEVLGILFDPGSPLVEHFAAMPRQPLVGQPRPVICLDTGRQFRSAAAAARTIHVTPSALRAAIYKGRPTAGLRFRYIDQADAA